MILLDTAAIIIVGDGQRLTQSAVETITAAEAKGDPIAVSAATAWELCLLEHRSRTGAILGHDGAAFFRKAVSEMGLAVIDIDDAIAIESRRLPAYVNPDPADRFIVATARLRRMTIVTSDRAMLDYARLGHVDAVRC